MKRNLLKNLLIIFFVVTNIAYAQFYYYRADLRKHETGFLIQNVYGINLETGRKEIILRGVKSPVVLHEINKIVFTSIPQLEICVYDAKKRSH